MITYRDRTFCSARCLHVDCSRRWTADYRTAADKWWASFEGQGPGAHVSFMNFSHGCPQYERPPGALPSESLGHDQTN